VHAVEVVSQLQVVIFCWSQLYTLFIWCSRMYYLSDAAVHHIHQMHQWS